MLFLFGESVRSKSASIGDRVCPVCQSNQPFTEQQECLWFCLFGIPLLRVEDRAKYWRCEHCLNAYAHNDLTAPSHVPITRRIVTYLLLGYGQEQHLSIAREICLKLTGFDYEEAEYRSILRELSGGRKDMVEELRRNSPSLNAIGKQQILEAAFLATYICCDMQYEDRLRVNLMGNAMDVGLEFVEYAIQQTRKQKYYGVHRLLHVESEV